MSWLTLRDGVRLRVGEFADAAGGPSAAGPPVVLVHGWKGSHRLWDPTVVELTARGARVVAFDLRGMGESDKPAGVYDFDTFADDLGELLDAFELRDATLVGWSMGCTVALRHLQRGGGRVGRLVLLNGPLRLTRAPDFPHAMSEQQLDGYLAELAAGWPASERAFQAESVLADSDPAVVDWLYGIALQTPLPVALSAVREQAKLDMRPAIAALRVPVLAAYAVHDPYYPTSLGDWIAANAPDGRAQVFEHSAHGTPFEEAPALAQAIVAFGAETGRTDSLRSRAGGGPSSLRSRAGEGPA
ncbi:alpha/beta fold hydrolase [Conexibacter woesei]|uniref:Alpha/beta hydrolase fold protein n=1 Tax=Conexibacter woesei (strain DSM 14684 / CCUG 47730 / CIP 108061 / JCM 11494 / NBRC 100937 / ID131577) TaxID=469383 RepID=D3F2N2_CONWI|nr:alpha/beta hydrolase [Conexibacter woesei]ADB52298.1 alpha/beta hydrolase fold protein [Conexibacter woesei DSM 14684]